MVQLDQRPAIQHPPTPRADEVQPDAVAETDPSEIIDYLSNLGLSDHHMSRVNSLLRLTQSTATVVQPQEPDHPAAVTSQKTVTVFLAEEQPIFRALFHSSLANRPGVEIVGSTADCSSESLVTAALEFCPQVMVLGVKGLQASTVEKLESIREACPETALVLLFSFSNDQGIKALREFSRDTSVGRAYLPKHTIDTVEQMEQVVHWVSEGRMIIDPAVMERLFQSEGSLSQPLKELSPKAVEVLHWLAKGYRNETIAEQLSRDTKTIERHINNIYSTFEEDERNEMHPRVRATLVYLKAVGQIQTD